MAAGSSINGERGTPTENPLRFTAAFTAMGLGQPAGKSARAMGSRCRCLRLRGLEVTLYEGVDHVAGFAADDVRLHADDAHAAQRHEQVGVAVVAAIDVEAVFGRTGDLGDLIEVPAGLLDGHDVVHGAQPRHGVGRHVEAGARGHVVEHVGQRRGLRDGLEMEDQSVLRRLVVVGRDLQEAVHADLGGLARQVHAFRSVVAAGSRNDLGAVAHGRQRLTVELEAFVVAEHRRLARGAGDDDRVVAGVDESGHQAPERVVVHRAIVGERGDNRGNEPAERQHATASARDRPGGRDTPCCGS